MKAFLGARERHGQLSVSTTPRGGDLDNHAVPLAPEEINNNNNKLEGFQFATSLDLNMGYYHIK